MNLSFINQDQLNKKFLQYPELVFELAFKFSNELKNNYKSYVFRSATTKELTFENVKTREYLRIGYSLPQIA
tara:strand:- start:350 stop:565 length:216 start_codon:yes stop_codon:yes gene_type:complete